MAYRSRPATGVVLFFALALTLSVYFMFAAVQGDFGVLRRAEVESEKRGLQLELDQLMAEIALAENKTHRLSDDFLDLDLLDQQARDVLGMVRADEVVIR